MQRKILIPSGLIFDKFVNHTGFCKQTEMYLFLPEKQYMGGQYRKDIYTGLAVAIILKKDQRTGKLTEGIVKDLLTSSSFHSRGIKVRLEDGQVGRVAEILEE